MTGEPSAAPLVSTEDCLTAKLSPDRTILEIEATPPRPTLAKLVGERGGGKLRKALAHALPDERARATPLYLLLDDISGASLVSGWAWSQWDPDWLGSLRRAAQDPELARAFPDRVGICVGFADGSSAHDLDTDRSGTPAPELVNPADLDGWHILPARSEVAFRRARRIDVWLDDVIRIDSAFQDSATTPAGGRAVVHEYTLTATADPASLRLLSVEAQPRVLPFAECPAAAAGPARLLGAPLPELRTRVLEELRGSAGCTHLNDALRALADVPALARLLET